MIRVDSKVATHQNGESTREASILGLDQNPNNTISSHLTQAKCPSLKIREWTSLNVNIGLSSQRPGRLLADLCRTLLLHLMFLSVKDSVRVFIFTSLRGMKIT